ncbi:MAG: DUF1015 domain-containing protein [Chloroflexi bacterium]|nr:DUF1015 domain-containing protein [Chloroflexota bacterium]
MAEIQPFRGIRFDPGHVGDLSNVITQPYDRIHTDEQARYYGLSPYNLARIIQGRRGPQDHAADNVYTRAACYARTWHAEGVLQRDACPCIYVLDQTELTPDGSYRTRRGLSAALALTPFDEGTVLPHERTLSGPKADRLDLTRATEVHWGHVFILYPDDGRRVEALLEDAVASSAPLRAREQVIESRVEQRLWVIDGPQIIGAVCEELAPKRGLIIADGHHRYETALAFRDEMRERYPESAPRAAFNYVLTTLVSMGDPGLVILPTHRLVHSYGRMSSEEFLDRTHGYFDVQRVTDRDAMEAALQGAERDRPRFGFYDGAHTILTLRDPTVMAQLLPERAPAWRLLDVTVLHELLIERVLGIDKDAVERHENIHYVRDASVGYSAVDVGEAEFFFVLNPTRMDQVRACAAAGERMPQKSTDFYPKVVSGLVALPVGPAEQL